MVHLTVSDYVLIGMVAMVVIGKVMKLCGWDRGALIADELQDALQSVRGLIAGARAGQGALSIDKACEAAVAIDKASEVAAAQVKGMSSADMRPIVESLAERAADKRYGVNISLDGAGNVSVDPSGLAAKLAHKTGKWLKKVF